MKFKTRRVVLTLDQKNQLIIDYKNHMRKKDLKTKYYISTSYLNVLLRKAGFHWSYDMRDRARKYQTNEKYFDIINTEEKAYWFGFLLADGYISAKKTSWSVQLRLIDLDAIQKLKLALESSVPIKTIYSDKRKTCYELSIASKYMVESLGKYGMVNNKTFRVRIPETIDKKLWPHIIRGYSDGDGCIYVRKDKYQCANFSITSSSIEILNQIEKYFQDNNIIKNNRSYISDYKTYRTINIGTQSEVKDVLRLLYGQANIYLDRKYKKAHEVLSRI